MGSGLFNIWWFSINEYDIEIKSICERINSMTNETELAKIIHDSFWDKMWIKLNSLECLKYSYQIIEEMNEKREK